MSLPQLGSLHQAISDQCPEVRKHPIVGRRVANVMLLMLSEEPGLIDNLNSQDTTDRVRARYRQVYGSPIIIAILLQVLISIIAKVIANWILEWWNNRQDQDDTPDDEQVRSLITSLGSQAQAEISADSHT